MKKLMIVLAVMAVFGLATAAQADTVFGWYATSPNFSVTNNAILYAGQSLTTPTDLSGGDQLSSFCFFSSSTHTPSASGTLYVYQGVVATNTVSVNPSGLPSYTTNRVAVSTGVSGGKFLFGPGITLLPNTVYSVFSDTSYAFAATRDNSAYTGGMRMYGQSGFNWNTVGYSNWDLNFEVTLEPDAPPIAEPASLGLVGVAFLAMRKRRS